MAVKTEVIHILKLFRKTLENKVKKISWTKFNYVLMDANAATNMQKQKFLKAVRKCKTFVGSKVRCAVATSVGLWKIGLCL